MQEPDVSLKKRKIGEPDFNPGGSVKLNVRHTPRGENLSKGQVQEMRNYWRGALQLSTSFFVTRHLSTLAEIALQ